MSPPDHTSLVEDLLRSGLRIVFCGTALGRRSASTKSYYAHSSNLFWSSLHAHGLTPHQFKPAEWRQLGTLGIGLTDLCKIHFGNDDQLPLGALDAPTLRRKIEQHQPRFLAFTSKAAGKAFCGPKTELGWQQPIGKTRVYVLPSTSLNARWQWNETKHHWQLFADAARGNRAAAK